MAVVATVIGVLAVVAFSIVAYLLADYLLARAGADKGLMAKMPANSFPAQLDLGWVSPPVIEPLILAGEWWRGQLGIEVFVTDEVDGVRIMVEEVQGTGFYARTTYVEDKLIVLLLVNMRAVDREPDRLFRAMCHELGHVLGLDHDDDPESVMYGKLVDGDFKVTERDLELVRNRIWRS